jgi:hypothetical protein
MKTTAQKLNMTPEEFEAMTFGFYFRWCQSVSITDQDFQCVLANSGVNRWFMTELAKLEAEFAILTKRYEDSPTVSVKDYQNLYNECTFHMFNIRPMVLLENAKIKLPKGVKVFNQILQN